MNRPIVLLLEHDGALVIKLAGKARAEAAADLRQKLIDADVKTAAMIDWEEVEHVDASVMQVLLALRQHLIRQGHPLTVARDNVQVREHLQVSGLSDCFPPSSSFRVEDGAQLSDSTGQRSTGPLRPSLSSSEASHG